MKRANFFRSWCDHKAPFNHVLVQTKVKVFIDLSIIDKSHVSMVPQELRLSTVDGIDGAPLELIDEAGDDFGPLLTIWYEDGYLMLVRQLT